MHDHCTKEVTLCINAHEYDKNHQKLLSLPLSYGNGDCQSQFGLLLVASRSTRGRG